MSHELDIQRSYWNAESDAFQKIYSHEKSALSNALDRWFRQDMYQRYLFTIDRSEPIAGKSILDVGCGNGLYSVEYARRGARRVVGLDVAEQMIALCDEAAEREGFTDRCSFLHSDLLAYDSAERFDVTIGIGLFDYIAEPLPVLRKMREVTRGKMIASFPRLWTWRMPIRKARLTLRGCPVFFFSRGKVESLLRDAGFASPAITTVGKLYCVVAETG